MIPLFIDNFYDNASQFNWEQTADGVIEIQPITDHSRFSPNSLFVHWNFKVIVPSTHVGSEITIRFKPVNGCYNGVPNILFINERMATAIRNGADSTTWHRIPMIPSRDESTLTEFTFVARETLTHVAHIVPYDLSDNQSFVDKLSAHEWCNVEIIGETVEKRPLELITLGNPQATHKVFLRARAHPWESGGSWLLEGLGDYLIEHYDDDNPWHDSLCLYIMPMANKDGVYRGMNKYTVTGGDLNRHWGDDWNEMAEYMPENVALRNWLDRRKTDGTLPQLGICLHNDSDGGLMPIRPALDAKNLDSRKNIERFGQILEEESWFNEGVCGISPVYSNSYMFNDGMMTLYNMDAAILEINCDWADGLKRAPLHLDWKDLGKGFAGALLQYFRLK